MYEYDVICVFKGGGQKLGKDKTIIPVFARNIRAAKKWVRKCFYVYEILKVKRSRKKLK